MFKESTDVFSMMVLFPSSEMRVTVDQKFSCLRDFFLSSVDYVVSDLFISQ